MATPSRILIRSPNWIGDQILAYPFFYFLRKAFPSAKIVSACVPWVQSIQFRTLVDEVFVLPRAMNSGFWAKWDELDSGARMLRNAGPWDFGISLPNSFSSAWLLYQAGVKCRRGFGSDGRSILLNQRMEWKECRLLHRAEAYFQLLQGLLPEDEKPAQPLVEFWGVPSENDLDPGTPGILSQFDAEKEWPDAEPLDPPEGPYWVLAPGSTAESRRWSVEKFAALAQIVSKETGWKGVIVGGPAEMHLASRLAEDSSLNLSDKTAQGTVASNWKIFRNARVSVCNDSGLAHVASLCGSPVQVIWGGGDPKRTEPLGPGKVQLSLNPIECWPCERNECSQVAIKKLDCLKGINPHAVWNEIKSGIRPF